MWRIRYVGLLEQHLALPRTNFSLQDTSSGSFLPVLHMAGTTQQHQTVKSTRDKELVSN